MEEIIKPRGYGRPRSAGRPKGALNKKTAALHDLMDQMGMSADPLRYLLALIASDGCVQVPVVDPESGKPMKDEKGKPVMEWKAVTVKMKLDACRDVLPYLRPKLAATQVSGQDGGPVQTAVLDIAQILADPTLARDAQRLALAVIEQQDAGLPEPACRYDPGN